MCVDLCRFAKAVLAVSFLFRINERLPFRLCPLHGSCGRRDHRSASDPYTYCTDWQKEKAAGVVSSDLRHIVVGHPGQSSQLFPVAPGRNAQFLATVARSALDRQVEIDLTVQKHSGFACAI